MLIKPKPIIFFISNKGFTIIELIVVVAIIGVLSTIVISNVKRAREAAYFAGAKEEMSSIHNSVELYLSDHGEYPPDTLRSIPPGLKEYLVGDVWTTAKWPGSVFDWDNWSDPNTGEKIYQISIRFCPIGQPTECRFPNQVWAENFDISSSVYYCIYGPCRAHISEPIDHPGYCVNCGN